MHELNNYHKGGKIMIINMTFDSYEEVVDFAKKIAAGQTVPEAAKEIKTMPVKKSQPVKEGKKPAEAPVKEEAVEETEAAAPAEEDKQYTLEDVRAALGALQKAGKKEQVREILQSFGAAKLPEVDPSDYPALMQKAGEMSA